MKRFRISLLACGLVALLVTLAACSSAAQTNQGVAGPEDGFSEFTDVGLCGLTIKMDESLVYDPEHSYGPRFQQYVYHFNSDEYVSQMVFRGMGSSEAFAKTFSGDGLHEDELAVVGSIFIGDLNVDVLSGVNCDGSFTFVYFTGDDEYGFALGFKGGVDDKGTVNEALVQFLLESAAFDSNKAMEAIPPDDGKVEVIFSDGGIGPNGVSTGGSAIKIERVEVGGSATPPEDPTASGYLFMGWEGEYTNVQSDVSIIAQWEEIGGVEIGAILPDEVKADLVGFACGFVEKQLGLSGGHDFLFPSDFDEYSFYNYGHGNGMAPEGSEVYRVVGYVDMVDREGVNHRKKYWVDIDYILLERSCHLNQSEIGYDE